MVDIIRAPSISDDVVIVGNGGVEGRNYSNENKLVYIAGSIDKRRGERRAVAGRVVDQNTFDELKVQAEEKGFQQGLENGHSEGLSKGYEKGFTTGEKRAAEEYQVGLTRLAETLAAFSDSRDTYIETQKGMIVKIAALSVARLLGMGLTEEQGVISAVETVIENIKKEEPFTVLVARKDLPVIERHWRETKSEYMQRIKLLPSDEVDMGGCLVVSPEGNTDGRIEVRLQMLVDAINAVITQKQGSN